MIAAGTMAVPVWLMFGIGVLGLLITGLITAQLVLSLRQRANVGMLTAELSQTGTTLKRDVHASHEAALALQQRLDETLERLREARARADQADRANEAKSAFLAMMSHELRTPLSAIIGFSELIEQQALGPIGNAKYSDYATDIRQAGRHLLGIINDILDLSKVESGKENLKEQKITPAALLDGVRVLIEGRAREAEVSLTFDFPDDLPNLRADKRRLTQVLVNLLSNAVKFTPEGGQVTLRCWATKGSGFVFQAIDSGIGMAQEDIPLALSVFGQVENDRQRQGTGLGLPLAKALAELHGGTLDLQSELGQGTTATLRLPARRIAGPVQAERPTPELATV